MLRKLFLYAMLLGTLFSCSSKKHEEKKTFTAYIQQQPLSLHPQKGGNRYSQIVLKQLFEGLYRLNTEGKPEEALAESVSISDDKKTYTFKLKDTKWSNGDPVTASDFEYAWKITLDPALASAYGYAFGLIKNAQKIQNNELPLESLGVQAMDDKTLRVELEHPAPYFLEWTTNPLYSPIPSKIAQENPQWHEQAGDSYVSNGPFVLTEHKHNAEIGLSKNPLYFDAQRVPTEKINFFIIESPETAYNMYREGSIDWFGSPYGDIPLELVTKLKNSPEFISKNIGCVLFYSLNTTKHPLLASKKTRQALARAINREIITTHLLQGGEEPAFSIIPESFSRLKEPAFHDGDKDEAKKLFNEGVQESSIDLSTLPPLEIHCSVGVNQLLAEIIQQQLQECFGIKVVLIPSDYKTLLQKTAKAETQMSAIPWFPYFSDPMYNLQILKEIGKNFNATNWSDPAYADLLTKIDNETDIAKRDEYLKEAELFLVDAMPVIPVYYDTYKYVKKPYVHGEYVSPIGGLDLKWLQIDKS